MFEPYYRNTAPEWVSGPAISLRDWFAGQALNGFLSNPENSTAEFEALAAVVYEVADAMLKERNKP